jgi:preprotein translocase subunit SecE
MNKLFLFIKESFIELRTKVTWPKYSELQSHTTLVLVASIIFALLIGAVDFAFDNALGWFYKNF